MLCFMKKLISGMLFVAAMGLSFGGSNADAQSLAGADSGECKDKIERNGGIIRVTVCGRSTDLAGLLAGQRCNADSDSSCSFTN
jgi:hypothetical protein